MTYLDPTRPSSAQHRYAASARQAKEALDSVDGAIASAFVRVTKP
jgi:hypothetical protein